MHAFRVYKETTVIELYLWRTTMASKDPLRQENAELGPKRAWSIHEASPLLGSIRKTPAFVSSERRVPVPRKRRPQREKEEQAKGNFVLYVIYAIVNVIIAVPGLYGKSRWLGNVAHYELVSIILFKSHQTCSTRLLIGDF